MCATNPVTQTRKHTHTSTENEQLSPRTGTIPGCGVCDEDELMLTRYFPSTTISTIMRFMFSCFTWAATESAAKCAAFRNRLTGGVNIVGKEKKESKMRRKKTNERDYDESLLR